MPSTAIPVITSPATATAIAGQSFSYQIAATNTPTSFGADDNITDGLNIDTATGIISGTLYTVGSYTFSVFATNAAGTGTAVFSLTVAAAPPASSAGVRLTLDANTLVKPSFYAANPPPTEDGTASAPAAPFRVTGPDGTVAIPNGTREVFCGSTLMGDLTLILPLASGYPPGAELTIFCTYVGDSRIGLLPQTNNSIDGSEDIDGTQWIFTPDSTLPGIVRVLVSDPPNGDWVTINDVLPASKGGTGQTSLQAAATALGACYDHHVTSVGDGAAGSLEAIPTAAINPAELPVLKLVYAKQPPSGTFTVAIYVLEAGTSANSQGLVDPNGAHTFTGEYFVIRPLDYNPVTNPKVWNLRG